MTRRRILLVGEDPALWDELQAAYGDPDSAWDLAFAKTGLQALASLAQSPCDAVVADMQMQGMTGAQLLDEIIQRSPKTLRFIRANLGDQQAAMKCVGTAHQYLVKPSDARTVVSAWERAFSLESWLPSEPVQRLISLMKKLPSPPNLYFQIVAEIQSPSASLDGIGKLISQDLVLSAKLLQLVNSAVFGLQLQVSKPAEAVAYIGMETTKALVLLAHTFSYFDKVKTPDFSIDRLWQHSLATGRCSERIARAETKDPDITGAAFTAGMLHDIGKLLLAANLPEEFKQALVKCRQEQVQLWEAEQAVLGATHGELGACLLGIWGLPVTIVEAVALHHHPARFLNRDFCPLTAVHAGNVLEHEARADAQHGLPMAALDLSYLTELGRHERVEVWQGLCREKESAA